MRKENEFSYTYSAKENQEVLHIRRQYLPEEKSAVEMLKALDAKVKRPANVFAYTYGSVAAIVMGAGMSLVMTDIGAMLGLAGTMVPGIAIGIVGMVMALFTYPIHKRMLASRRKKYAPEIIRLSESIMEN